MKISVTLKIDQLHCEYPAGVDGYVWPVVVVTDETGRVLKEASPPNKSMLQENDQFAFDVEVGGTPSPADRMVYLVVYRPEPGWDLDQHQRDHLIATGNVLEVRASSLYSLQFTEMRFDRITRRPLGVVLLNMSDRYGYAEGRTAKGEGSNWKVEPFEVFEAKDLRELELYCRHLRPREYEATAFIPDNGDPGEANGRARNEVRLYREWAHAFTGAVAETSYRVLREESVDEPESDAAGDEA